MNLLQIMRKELIFAILISATFGAVLAFGVWRTNAAFNTGKPEAPATITPKAAGKNDSGTSINNSSIALTSPKGNVALDEVEEFSGITLPNSWFVISTKEEDYLLPIDSTGEFTQKVDIIGGMNDITLAAFGENSNFSKDGFQTVYSSLFVKQVYGDKEEDETDLTEEEIQKRVENKIKAASDAPIAYIGSITDIAEDTIQMKSQTGEIKQMTTDGDTSYVSIGSKVKEIKSEDLAIGDFVASMGFTNDQDILSSKRILVFANDHEAEKVVAMGTIKELNNQTFVLDDLYGGTIYTIDPETGYKVWDYTEGQKKNVKYANLDEGDQVIIAGHANEDDSSIVDTRTIYIVKKSEDSDE